MDPQNRKISQNIPINPGKFSKKSFKNPSKMPKNQLKMIELNMELINTVGVGFAEEADVSGVAQGVEAAAGEVLGGEIEQFGNPGLAVDDAEVEG